MNKKYIYLILTIFVFLLFHSNMVYFVSNINSLLNKDNKYELLKKAYDERIENLNKEISEYEKISNLEITKDKSLVLSKVALRDIYHFFDYLIISTSYKVEKGDVVINENGLIGIIDSSSIKEARVNLLTGNNKISVKVNNSYGLLGLYNKRTKLFKITNITNYETINEGDIVKTSGLSDIPEGIYVGKVVKIDRKGIEQEIYVKSDIDFENINYLYVLNSIK